VWIRQTHFERLNCLGRQMESIALDAAGLSALENQDNIFPTNIFSRFEPT